MAQSSQDPFPPLLHPSAAYHALATTENSSATRSLKKKKTLSEKKKKKEGSGKQRQRGAKPKERILRSNRLSTGVHVGKLADERVSRTVPLPSPPSPRGFSYVSPSLSLSIPLSLLPLDFGEAEGRGLIPGSSVEREIPRHLSGTWRSPGTGTGCWQVADISSLPPAANLDFEPAAFHGLGPVWWGGPRKWRSRGKKPRFCSNKSSTLLDLLFMQPRYGIMQAISNRSSLSFFLRVGGGVGSSWIGLDRIVSKFV